MANPSFQASSHPLDLLGTEVADRIRALELFSRFRVQGFLNGNNPSPSKGFSTDFLQHRQYFRGDNLKYLDWRVYGKTERLYIREYEETTNTQISVLLDVSNSMSYRANALSKHEFAVRCAAALLYLAFLQKDSFSLTTFHRQRALRLPFRSGKRHFFRALQVLADQTPGGLTDFTKGLEESIAPIRRRGLTIVLSDFMGDPESIVRTVSRLRFQGSDVIAMQVFDPSERELAFTSITRFHDLEDEEILVVDPQILQREYQREFDAHQLEMKEACFRHGFDYTPLPVSEAYEVPLAAYLQRRMELFR
ncbi:MAG: DUF58 domain-containing protein [Planctomycetes bacterium]|nr:DUF58 domain-containing protein [Planctomycetota bacterium]